MAPDRCQPTERHVLVNAHGAHHHTQAQTAKAAQGLTFANSALHFWLSLIQLRDIPLQYGDVLAQVTRHARAQPR